MLVNSTGGTTAAGFEFYDLVTMLGANLATFGSGSIGSMSVIIFLAGTKRIITPNTSLFLHHTSRVFAKPVTLSLPELQSITRSTECDNELYQKIILAKTGEKLSAEQLKQMMLEQRTLSAEEIVKSGPELARPD